MPTERQIYLLDPQSIDPETIAVAFAKTSRSPETFRKIAAELSAEKSAQFHERWVVGYGHASVAEHAVLHVAMENISRLAVETIESSRLASYTEKSTRYQKWSVDEYYTPPEIENGPAALRELYQSTCLTLFQTYLDTLPAVRQDVETDHPRREGESEAAWERRIRSEYVDVCRFLLPAAAQANLGMTINARVLEHSLRKMFSHPLQEVREIGQQIKDAAMASTPTLIKYVERVPYLEETSQELAKLAQAVPPTGSGDWCTLVGCAPEGETWALAAALYRFGGMEYNRAISYTQSLDPEQRRALAHALLGRMGKFDVPLRETEFANYAFDVVIDQGGYFELKRHRMMTQTPQPLTADLGYATPRRMVSAGVADAYHRAMQAAEHAYQTLEQENPHVAAYVVPNGFRRRVLLGMNYRSALHFVGLRSAENAHFSMRRLALRIGEEIRRATPLLGAYLRMPEGLTCQQIEEQYFDQA